MSKMLQRKAGLFGTRCMNTRHSTLTFAFVTSILISVFLGSCVELVGYLCLIDLKKNTKKSREVYSGGWQVGGILSLETGDAEGVLRYMGQGHSPDHGKRSPSAIPGSSRTKYPSIPAPSPRSAVPPT